MKLLMTKKEVFQLKLRGEPIKLDMTEGDGRWAWPAMMEFFFDVDVLKKLPNGDVEVLHEIHATVPFEKSTSKCDDGELISRTMILRVNQILSQPPEGTSTVAYGLSD